MEFFRWILILTGIVLLVVAYMMGRKKKHTNVYHRQTPEAYDPSLDELSMPIADVSANVSSDAHSARPLNHASETDDFLTDAEIDAAIPASDGYGAEPLRAEIDIRDDFDDIDLEVDEHADQSVAHTGTNKVTSFASAVKQVTGAGENAEKNFSDEFDTYHEPVQLEDFEEKLVTVHVAASNDRRFYGSDLKVLFEQHGYTFGRMSLFHCALDGDKVFSIANMVKPGTFDQEQMSSFETPGITLFMRLPIELDADVAFDFLIREAKELAEELNGHLRDGDRNPLSEQTIQHMREDIQQYVFRTKRVLHTS